MSRSCQVVRDSGQVVQIRFGQQQCRRWFGKSSYAKVLGALLLKSKSELHWNDNVAAGGLSTTASE